MSDLSDKPSMPSIYALTDDTTDAEFEAALTEARDDSNVSRANAKNNSRRHARTTIPARKKE